MRDARWFGLVLSCLPLLLAAWGCDPAEEEEEVPPAEDPFADYVPDPDVFSTPIDLDDLVEIDGLSAPPDQAVVLLEEDASLADILDASGGAVIGQAPDLGIYQLELPSSSAAELTAQLEALAALAGVEAVLPNHRIEAAGEPSADGCLSDDDLDQVTVPDQRCPMSEIQYRQFVPIALAAAELTSLHTVKVAVIDTGLAPSTQQFGDVPHIDLRGQQVSCQDPDGHGTRVAALIAADNGDGGVNGIATRVLGPDHLRLFVGQTSGFMEIVTSLVLAGKSAKVDVVNMSVGCFYTNPLWAAAANLVFTAILAHYDDVLYVFAAGNDNREIGLHNVAPMALDLDHVITVGGTALCDPDTRWTSSTTFGSNHGSAVDIAAPAEDVPVQYFYPKNNMDLSSGPPDSLCGTSYAAPMVASLAAVLASFSPDRTPEQLRAEILDNSFAAPADVGGRRLQMALALEQLLIEDHGSLEIQELVDADLEPGVHDNPSVVVNRICGGATITIDGVGTWTFEGDVETNSGSLIPGMTAAVFQDLDEGVTFAVQLDTSFQIETPNPIGSGAMVTFAKTDGTAGTATSGSTQLTSCAITERDGYLDLPLMVEVSGVASGSMEVASPPELVPAPHGFDAGFTLPLIAMGDDTLNEYLEEHCDGGHGVD